MDACVCFTQGSGLIFFPDTCFTLRRHYADLEMSALVMEKAKITTIAGLMCFVFDE